VTAVTAAQALRKPHWFEKFHWFVTSENQLVLSGRDAQQNELLVKRYLRKDDLYVHADLHGAATTIVRNNDPSKPGVTQSQGLSVRRPRADQQHPKDLCQSCAAARDDGYPSSKACNLHPGVSWEA
jgi:predicted ribosome quality control (RQC) complex YloA/Tae2 family protein